MSLDAIREYLSYDPQSGLFTWIKRPGFRVRIGDIAGNESGSCGYRRIRFRGREHLAHRLAWWFVHGEYPPRDGIDHMHGVEAGDGIKNLRRATSGQNKCNTGLRRDNTSGYKGVSFFRQTDRWFAEVHNGGRRVWSGYFSTAEEAARARDAEAIKHHGAFVWLNFPVSASAPSG